MTVRAKFRCDTVEQATPEPTPVMRYLPGGGQEPTGETTWPRTFRFSAVCDPTIPEDVRYAKYTPSGSLTITVDNPDVTFQPGQHYYLDFTAVEES